MNNLYSKLIEYSKSDIYPFHMPGHKRSIDGPYRYDVTEINGFDNLHNPEGLIKEIMERASLFYGSKKTYLLVNGSTCGILSAICSVVEQGDKILIARNCHKSVYNGLFLMNLKPVYIYSEKNMELGISGEISLESVEKALIENPDIRAAVITSPTYEGIVSDVDNISELLHSKGIPLIVDGAHGAHLGLHPDFLPSSVGQGADIVIQSVHKTLPSLTQTALLHYNSSIVDMEKLETYLGIYQTSSPSYVLMSSIERCIDLLIENGSAIFNDYLEVLRDFIKRCNYLKNIRLINEPNKDITKLVISIKNTDITAKELNSVLLNEYHLQFEMVAGDYVLGITSFCDSQEGFDRLYKALFEIDNKIKYQPSQQGDLNYSESGKIIFSAKDAFYMEKNTINIEDSLNKISGEYKFMYPPGIPVIVPGELITSELIEDLKRIDNKIKVIKGAV